MKKIRITAIILVILTVVLIPTTALAAQPGNAINKTVNLADVSKNARGNGYEWANLTNTLTLDNLNINTVDEFGMKIPKDATVILKGNNYITAASVGLVCTGQVTFEGSGTLTVTAGDVGIDMTGVYTSHLARFSSGTITVTAGSTAIRSASAEISLMGSSVNLNITGDRASARAISGRTVTVSGGSLTANAGVYASNSLKITSSDIDISAEAAALECPNGITITKEKISAGDTASTLSPTEEYKGEKAIKLISTASKKKPSILFGEKSSSVADYVVFTLIALAVAALIAVPIYLKKKKTEKLIAEYAAANPAKKTKTADNNTSKKNTDKN
ncbi:MAG: hypothetical protein IJY04_05910 [Clostridia bacterium]|nr:hypothetical protein [Clostridia bacterium]